MLKPARDIAGLYAIIDGASGSRDALIWPVAVEVARGIFRDRGGGERLLSVARLVTRAGRGQQEPGDDRAHRPGHARPRRQRPAAGGLAKLREQSQILRQGLNNLAANFTTQARLLRDAIDGNQGAMAAAIDQLSAQMRVRERLAQERFDRTLGGVYRKVAIVALRVPHR